MILAGPPCCNTELHWIYAAPSRFLTEVNQKFLAFGNRKIIDEINDSSFFDEKWRTCLHLQMSGISLYEKYSSCHFRSFTDTKWVLGNNRNQQLRVTATRCHANSKRSTHNTEPVSCEPRNGHRVQFTRFFSLCMNNYMHYSKQNTTDSTSMKFAARAKRYLNLYIKPLVNFSYNF